MSVAVGERVTAETIPPRTLSEAGSWLCRRHSELQELVARVGMWDADSETPNMYQLRELVVKSDRQDSVHMMCSPRQRAALHEVERMSPGELGRLRLLATLADRPAYGQAPQFSVSDLLMFDHAGKEIITDYLRAVRVAVCG